jgi:uncharacterized protein with HEPN domain
MLTVKDVERLLYMRHVAYPIRHWTQDQTLAQLNDNLQARFAIERAFTILGEIVKDIGQKHLAENIPTILWGGIIGTRNYLSHSYDDAFSPRLWQTVQERIPPLIIALDEAVGQP